MPSPAQEMPFCSQALALMFADVVFGVIYSSNLYCCLAVTCFHCRRGAIWQTCWWPGQSC